MRTIRMSFIKSRQRAGLRSKSSTGSTKSGLAPGFSGPQVGKNRQGKRQPVRLSNPYGAARKISAAWR